MTLDLPKTAVLLCLPFGRHLLVKGRIDGAVQLVDIGGVDSVLEPVVFGAQPLYRRLVLATLIGVALMQRVVPRPFRSVVTGF